MTMTTQENAPASAEIETPVPGYQRWCPRCFTASIERLCLGFTVYHNDPKFPPRFVPALHPAEAKVVRDRAALILIQREGAQSEAASHPNHAGAGR